MLTSLKNITERAQKCDFSVNFHILIEQTGFRFDILCQKVDITLFFEHLTVDITPSLEEDLPTLKCSLASKT